MIPEDEIKLPFNLDVRDERDKLTQMIRTAIFEARGFHQTFVSEMNEVEERLLGNYTVAGYNDSPIQQLKDAVDKTLNTGTSKTPLIIKVPRSRPNQESTIGQYVNTPRDLSITPRNPADKAFARIVTARIKYIEDTFQVKNQIYFPTIDAAFSKGLHWLELTYDHSKVGIDKFKIDEISARDVLVDSRSRGIMFKTAKMLFKRFEVEREKAIKDYKNYPLFNPDLLLSDSQDRM